MSRRVGRQSSNEPKKNPAKGLESVSFFHFVAVVNQCLSDTFAYDENGNRTRQVESRPANRIYTTTYAYNKANWLVANTDATNATTNYDYDLVGNRTGVTDPLGVSTAITYTQVNLPSQTTHTQNSVWQDTTTNSYDSRNDLVGQATVAPSVTLSTTATYNPNNYLTYINNLESSPKSGSRDYSLTLFDNNLVNEVVPGNQNSYPFDTNYWVYYDSANRVKCWSNGTDYPMMTWQYYSDSKRHYQFWRNEGGGLFPVNCTNWSPTPSGGDVQDEYTYNGNQLIQRVTSAGNNPPTSIITFTYINNNLASELHVDNPNSTPTTSTSSYTWSWQASAYRLTTFFSSTTNVTTTFDYDSQGRIARRFTALGYSDYIYEDGTDWLAREFWHPISRTITGTFDLVRYWYVNGRPSRVEIATTINNQQDLQSYTTYYVQYNWHGDAMTFVDVAGSTSASDWGAYDPWGNATNPVKEPKAPWDYYRWNGGWGYLSFSALGMYYVHGRWYRPDLGLFISPNEKGDYIYGGDGQDAVNYGWSSLPATNNVYINPTDTFANNPAFPFMDCNKILDNIERALAKVQQRWQEADADIKKLPDTGPMSKASHIPPYQDAQQTLQKYLDQWDINDCGNRLREPEVQQVIDQANQWVKRALPYSLFSTQPIIEPLPSPYFGRLLRPEEYWGLRGVQGPWNLEAVLKVGHWRSAIRLVIR